MIAPYITIEFKIWKQLFHEMYQTLSSFQLLNECLELFICKGQKLVQELNKKNRNLFTFLMSLMIKNSTFKRTLR